MAHYIHAEIAGGLRVDRDVSGQIESVSRQYKVWSPLASVVPSDITPDRAGLPPYGSLYTPTDQRLRLTKYSCAFEYGIAIFTATYERSEEVSGGGGSGGSDPELPVQQEVDRSWTMQRSTVDLLKDAETGEAIVMPVTLEPLASAIQTEIDRPVFTITRHAKAIPASILAASGTVNANRIKLDGRTVEPRCGLLSVSAARVYDDPTWLWRYTITVAIQDHNMVTIDDELIDIGHDVAIVLQGYLVKRQSCGLIARATEIDEETGEAIPSTSPVLLNEKGERNFTGTPVFKRIAKHKSATWYKQWFFNEE